METTIAAISTAMSASGIGIVRISGENAMDVISRVYRSKGVKKKIIEVPSHTIHNGYIYDGEELVDEVLVMIMHAPRTFTGEDTVEIVVVLADRNEVIGILKEERVAIMCAYMLMHFLKDKEPFAFLEE